VLTRRGSASRCETCDIRLTRLRMKRMNRQLLLILVSLAACATLTAAAQASCIPMTGAQHRARADLIFNGVALEGPTATGIQRFRVTRFLKGSGPRIVRVNTGTIRRPDGSGSTTSVSLFVKKGEKWRIFARGFARRVLQSNACDGSRRL
jgi:hypothetical protein